MLESRFQVDSRSDPNLLRVKFTVGDAQIWDLSTPHTLFPNVLCMRAAPNGGNESSHDHAVARGDFQPIPEAGSQSAVEFHSLPLNHRASAASPTADSLLVITLREVRIVYAHSFMMELVDYISEGMVSVLVAPANNVELVKSREFLLIRAHVDHPLMYLPRNAALRGESAAAPASDLWVSSWDGTTRFGPDFIVADLGSMMFELRRVAHPREMDCPPAMQIRLSVHELSARSNLCSTDQRNFIVSPCDFHLKLTRFDHAHLESHVEAPEVDTAMEFHFETIRLNLTQRHFQLLQCILHENFAANPVARQSDVSVRPRVRYTFGRASDRASTLSVKIFAAAAHVSFVDRVSDRPVEFARLTLNSFLFSTENCFDDASKSSILCDSLLLSDHTGGSTSLCFAPWEALQQSISVPGGNALLPHVAASGAANPNRNSSFDVSRLDSAVEIPLVSASHAQVAFTWVSYPPKPTRRVSYHLAIKNPALYLRPAFLSKVSMFLLDGFVSGLDSRTVDVSTNSTSLQCASSSAPRQALHHSPLVRHQFHDESLIVENEWSIELISAKLVHCPSSATGTLHDGSFLVTEGSIRYSSYKSQCPAIASESAPIYSQNRQSVELTALSAYFGKRTIFSHACHHASALFTCPFLLLLFLHFSFHR